MPVREPLHRQAALVRDGGLDPVELLDAHLARVERHDGLLRAFTTVLADSARDEAKRARSRLAAGEHAPLLGVPVVVKDNVDVAGTRTTHGTRAVRRRATADAEAVRRLRAAGAVLAGKTTLPELAMWPHFTATRAFGVTRNPHDPARSPGGSSGGAAAAVAAGMAAGALGSDGGASIRVPAALCGLVGIKPQRGRVPLLPDRDHWHGLTHFGPLARTVRDAALLLDVLAATGTVHADAARAAAPGRLRVGLSLAPALRTPLDPGHHAAVIDVARRLEALGHGVDPAEPDFGALGPLTLPRYLRGIHDDARRVDEPSALEPRTRAMARLGGLVPRAALRRALAGEPARTRRIAAVFDDHDVLLTPVTAQPAPAADVDARRGAMRTARGMTPWIAYTAPWVLTGQPALALPAGTADDGMPLAVQLVGRPGDEATLVALAAQLEAEVGPAPAPRHLDAAFTAVSSPVRTFAATRSDEEGQT